MPYEKRNFAYNKRLQAEDFNYIDQQLIADQVRSNAYRDTAVPALESSIDTKIANVGIESSNGHVQLKYGNTKMMGVFIPTMETYLPPSSISAPSVISAWRGEKQKLDFSISPANSSLKPRFFSSDPSALRIDKDGIMTPLKIGKVTATVKCGTLTKSIPVSISAFIRPSMLMQGMSIGLHWATSNPYMYWDTVLDTNDNRYIEVAWVGNKTSFFAWPRYGGEKYEFQIPPHCTATFHIDNTGLDMENGSDELKYKFWTYVVIQARTYEPTADQLYPSRTTLVTDPPAAGKIAIVQSPTSQSYFIIHSDLVPGFTVNTDEGGANILPEEQRLNDLVIHNTSDVIWYPCIALTRQYSPTTHAEWIQIMQRFTCTIVPD